MTGNEALFRDFLSEVQALDDFRNEYEQRYDFQELGRDDQDVQRLMEAMAFYSARTRGQAERAMHRYELRALSQLFPHLLSPMPAMGLLYPLLTSNMTDARCLPAMAEVVVAPTQSDPALAESAQGAARARSFRTVSAIPILPLYVVKDSVTVRKKGSPGELGAVEPGEQRATGHRLRLEVAPSPDASPSRRYYDDEQQPLKELVLYINPQGDVLHALRIHDAIRESCRQVTSEFTLDSGRSLKLATRAFRFGMLPPKSKCGWDNPIAHARRLIQFPLAQLCIRVPLAGAPAQWTKASFELDLGEEWPSSLVVGDKTFLLNAGPIENLVRRTAEPIDSDGTRLRHRIDHQEPGSGLSVREVLGVYRGDPAQPGARTTLLPSATAGAGYAVDTEGRGVERESWLETTDVIGRVGAPERLYVDAEWYLPETRTPNAREVSVSVEAYDLSKPIWAVADPMCAPTESLLADDPRALGQLLELHERRLSSARDLQFLLQVLGVGESEVLARIPRYIASLDSVFTPDSRSPCGGVRSYDVTLSKLPSVLIPAARLLFRLLPGILGAWTGDPDVRVRVALDTSAKGRASVFEWRAGSDE